MGEIRNAYTILFRKSQGMKHVWTSTNGCKTDPGEMDCDAVD